MDDDELKDFVWQDFRHLLESRGHVWHFKSDVSAELFFIFLVCCLKEVPELWDSIHLFESPVWSLDALVSHLLHWPPKTPNRCSNFDLATARTRLFMEKLFPTLANHNKADLYCRQMAHKVVNGRYFSAAIEYRKDPCLKYHLALYKSLIESLSASETGTVQLLLFWGRPVRDWKKQVYGEGDQVVTKNAQAFVSAYLSTFMTLTDSNPL